MREDSVDVAGRKLKEVHSQYQEKTKEFDRLYEAFTKTSQVKKNVLNEHLLNELKQWSLNF